METSGEADLVLPGLGLTSDQQFFVSYGQTWCSKMTKESAMQRIVSDPHSPPLFRVRCTPK